MLDEEKVGRDKLFIHRKYLELLSSDEHDVRALSAERRRMSTPKSVAALESTIRARIAAAAREAGRDPAVRAR